MTQVWTAPTFTPELDARIIALRMQGMKPAEISRAVGRKDKSIRNRLRALAFIEARLEAAI